MRILPYLWQQRQQALDMGCDVLAQPLNDNVHEPKHLQDQQLCKQDSVLECIDYLYTPHQDCSKASCWYWPRACR